MEPCGSSGHVTAAVEDVRCSFSADESKLSREAFRRVVMLLIVTFVFLYVCDAGVVNALTTCLNSDVIDLLTFSSSSLRCWQNPCCILFSWGGDLKLLYITRWCRR